MKQIRPAVRVALTLMGLPLAPAFAQTDILNNGSFEAGLTGWTQATQVPSGGSGTCGYNAAAAPGTETITGLAGFPATSGTQLALGSVASTSPGNIVITCVLYQDVAIPAGATTATFTYDIGAKGGVNGNNAAAIVGLFSPATIPAFGNATIAGNQTSYLVATPDTVLHTQSSTPNFDVSARAGTTVRFAILNVALGSGNEVIGIDNVHLLVNVTAAPTVPALSGWALIALATLLGCAGFLALRQRPA